MGDGASRRSELQSREGASEHIHSDSENEGDEESSKRERQVYAGDRERLPTQNWSLQSSELLRQELTPYARQERRVPGTLTRAPASRCPSGRQPASPARCGGKEGAQPKPKPLSLSTTPQRARGSARQPLTLPSGVRLPGLLRVVLAAESSQGGDSCFLEPRRTQHLSLPGTTGAAGLLRGQTQK